MLEPGQLAEHGFPADMQPRVIDLTQPASHPVGGVDGACHVAGGVAGSGGEQCVRGWFQGPIQRVVTRLRSVSSVAVRNSPWWETT